MRTSVSIGASPGFSLLTAGPGSVSGLSGTMGFFGSLGYPPIFGAIVAFAEVGAGIALILGVLCLLLTLPSTAAERQTERPGSDA